MQFLDTRLILIILGLFFVGAGVAGLTGRWKRWYWTSKRMVYAYIPFGLLFFLAAAGTNIADQTLANVLRGVEFAVLAVAFWWIIRPPKAMRPAWIRMIEDYPPRVYEAMAAEVKGGKEWRSKVESIEALEKWIRSIEKSAPKKGKGR
jgi:hypothetical protein